MRRYANRTEVSVRDSQGEIQNLLEGQEAEEVVLGTRTDSGMVMFRLRDRTVRFTIALPRPTDDDMVKAPHGKTFKRRNEGQVRRAVEQETRRRWRALVLLIKAKLVSVADRVTEFDQEFLPYFVMEGGLTLFEMVQERLPALLSGRLALPAAPKEETSSA